ncbi:MAG: DUF5110 domain-containing protein [Saprospiraceae bacterium]|nr:DUF5110 domain-containing protein [Saprospiraceae bacterium]
MSIKVSYKVKPQLLIFLSTISFSVFAQPEWREVANSVWKTTIGNQQSLTLLSAAGVVPKLDAIAGLDKVPFPLELEKMNFAVVDGKSYLRFPLERDEEIYGLGLQFQTHNQRGRILNLHVDHYGGKDNGRTHAPVPFYISSRGYGVLIDAPQYITVYAGTGVRVAADDPPIVQDRNTDTLWQPQPYSDAVEILVPAEGSDVYVFGGPTMLNVVQRYNLYNGGGYLPPKWGLGFTQRVPTLYTAQDILREVQEFADHDFPLDFIGLEPGWQSMAYPCTFEWDKGRFPDPEGLITTLAEKGVRANLWLNPYVSPTASLYDSIKPFSGTHTVWNGLVVDFTLPKPRDIFRHHFQKYQLDIGVSGFKIDEVDGFDNWLWPDVARFPSGYSAEVMRQCYGLLLQKMTADWFYQINKRTYGLVRASNAGASAMPYVIYNDYYSHKDFITALINSSFIGVLWTPEVRASGSAEEWLRRMQSVCFSPMAMLNAWSSGTKPWTFPEVANEVRDVARLRMQLLPYLYTAFARYQQEGIPPFRAMQLESGYASLRGLADAPSITYQYMMGESILVAPMFTGDSIRRVALPPGKWYDFYTGAYVGNGDWITVKPGLDKIPLFVKDGGIIPMIEARNQAPRPDEKLTLEVRKYGTAPGSYLLYDDDGVSFDYEKGLFSWSELTAKLEDGKWECSFNPGNKEAFNYSEKVNWKFFE